MSDNNHNVDVRIRLSIADPWVVIIGRPLPTLLISPRAYLDTQYIIEAVPAGEVAWLGSVEVLPGERYLLRQVYLLQQTVTEKQCVLEGRDLNRFYTEALRAGGARRDEAAAIRFWGHLHPRGEPALPSLQDERQMAAFDHNPFFVRGIYTREGPCHFTFVDYERGLKIYGCPCELAVTLEDAPEREAAIAREVAEKVRFQRPRARGARLGRRRKGGQA